MTKVTRLDDFTEVDKAEGRLLNEIHEHISLGISQALGSLIAAALAEGARAEHARIFGLIRGACCYPIDGDKLFRLPIAYGDALPIKEPPCKN